MTDIYKKFFDTFGINPKYTYLVTDTFYTNNSHTYTATKDDLIDYFEGKNCGRYKVIKVYKNYPPFTDTKQLELIKWLALNFSQYSILHIDRWTSGKVRFALDKEKYTEPYYDSDYAYVDKDFSQALAGLVCELWEEELTEEQKEEVRGILQ